MFVQDAQQNVKIVEVIFVIDAARVSATHTKVD